MKEDSKKSAEAGVFVVTTPLQPKWRYAKGLRV